LLRDPWFWQLTSPLPTKTDSFFAEVASGSLHDRFNIEISLTIPSPMNLQLPLGLVALLQAIGLFMLLTHLSRGCVRMPALSRRVLPTVCKGSVTILVPTLNESARIQPCLHGLAEQGAIVREILVIDSCSTDGTVDKVKTAATQDPRFRLLTDPPLPMGWVGRPWALHSGWLASDKRVEWILSIDADTCPQPGLAETLVAAAEEEGYDMVSLAPRFQLEGAGEGLLQPAMLTTLLLRTDPAGARTPGPDTVLANGQCFLVRRSTLELLGGFEGAATSFCDDVTLARNAARAGFQVGFLDGRNLLHVRMYQGVKDLWQGWGRSLDLKDASTPDRLRLDILFLLLVQGLPIPILILVATLKAIGVSGSGLVALGFVNGLLVVVRFLLLLPIRGSYNFPDGDPAGYTFWLSPLADSLAVVRVILSSLSSPTSWRGRSYGSALVGSQVSG
jgi:dolichol-phosphate mannosyltransferase